LVRSRDSKESKLVYRKIYTTTFSVDILPPKNKTWAKERGNIIYAIAKLLPLLQKKIYFDIGANVGIHAWLCNKLGVDVYCFEPNKDLIKFIEVNSKPKAIYNFGISDSNCIGYLETNKQSVSNSVHRQETPKTKKVLLKKLDDLDLPAPGMVKFDVEGHEASAIQGSKDTLKKFCPWIVVEHKYHDINTEHYLKELNYEKHSIWPKDTIWHHPNNRIPIDSVELPKLDKDLRKYDLDGW
jgi:FkbM family methyltransferase